jgi:hypothetical protein
MPTDTPINTPNMLQTLKCAKEDLITKDVFKETCKLVYIYSQGADECPSHLGHLKVGLASLKFGFDCWNLARSSL